MYTQLLKQTCDHIIQHTDNRDNHEATNGWKLLLALPRLVLPNNNRLRAGILDLRSLAAGLKEEEKAAAARRAQDAQELAEGETSPRGPEVTQR